ncbi:MAG: Flp pilus assembly complex ATPase component TadA [Candidatus Riflebacteria bacterium]|nr:Flp pilus assembly complex ATPase component TadA [Candidatus Riflebacteria bacterium]
MNNTSPTKQTVESLMVQKGLLSEDQLEKARIIQAQTLERLENIIVRLGFLSERQILELWADFLGISVVDLTNIKVDAKILQLIPEYQAKQYKMIPYKREGNRLTVVMADPFDIMATDMVAFLTQCKLEVLIAPKNQIELAIRQLYSWEGFSVAGDESRSELQEAADSGIEVVRKTSEQGAVVQFLNAIFKQAILKRASDIHVEPREDILLVRFRVDGMLHDAMTGPKSLIAPLISRIKILSHLDIAERRLPQDGRLKVKMQDKEIDFRVSTVPSLLGEKAVLRLLQRESKFDLDNIGFFPEDLARLKSALDEPYGLILVTGPTGAGKTTTLFGMLKYFSSTEINIFTIENPVEYRIPGITQVQINDKIGLDFASGLRTALRQDPDIILVGEIRDLETAEIAFRASLTGHKVLSTLHTNNAPASINRLINMGVPAYLVTAAMRVAVAQKLLHRNCPHCKTEYRPSQSIMQRLNLNPGKLIGTKFYKGVGCRECNQTGTLGRTGVYETMVITASMKDVIMEGGTEMAIKRVARLEGMRTLREMAIDLAIAGESTLEEVVYVTPSDEEEKRIPLSGLLGAQGGSNIIMPVQMQPMSAAMQPNTMQAPAGMPQPSQQKRPAIDLNDPVIKTIITALEKEYLFLSDDKLAEKLHLPVLQVRELMQMRNLERTIDGFSRYFGKTPAEMSEADIADVIGMIFEKHGEIPGCIFEDETQAPIWASLAIKAALEKLRHKIQKPEELPEYFNEQFIIDAGLEQIYLWANRSRTAMIELAAPGKFKAWQFGETEQWLENRDIMSCAREALEWLMTEKLGCSRGDLPVMLSRAIFKENNLGALLEKFNDSCFQLVNNLYPNVFKPWQFAEEEPLIWFQEDRLEVAASATRWLIEERLGMPVEEIPKRISIREFHTNGLSKLLDLFNQNLAQVIENAYPERFKPWQFNEQSDLWKSPEAMETARQATEWLINDRLHITPEKAAQHLTRRHFINNGLGQMLGSLFNHSHFMALENCIEVLKTNEIFQKALFNYAHEVREINARWETIAEKIAINHFGKARFKVTLPNLKIAPIVPENERIYINAANQIEYVPQIVIPKLSAYSDFSDFSNWVPYCDRLTYWILGDDRGAGYVEPTHPKVKLVFVDALIAGLRSKGLLDVVEKVQQLVAAHTRMLDHKAPAGI